MTSFARRPLARRKLLKLGLGLPAIPLPFLLAGCDSYSDSPAATSTGSAATTTRADGSASPVAQATTLAPTPACGDDDEPTIAQTAGPFFTPNSPLRTSLREAGISGTPLVVSGLVLNTACAPVVRALVDFWQCDDAGVYDNTGFKLRGHQFTDANGRYRLETILPGVYTGRTRHIHVKVQAANHPVLTTQLYFPGEPGNARDGIFHQELVMEMRSAVSGQEGAFNFVLNV